MGRRLVFLVIAHGLIEHPPEAVDESIPWARAGNEKFFRRVTRQNIELQTAVYGSPCDRLRRYVAVFHDVHHVLADDVAAFLRHIADAGGERVRQDFRHTSDGTRLCHEASRKRSVRSKRRTVRLLPTRGRSAENLWVPDRPSQVVRRWHYTNRRYEQSDRPRRASARNEDRTDSFRFGTRFRTSPLLIVA